MLADIRFNSKVFIIFTCSGLSALLYISHLTSFYLPPALLASFFLLSFTFSFLSPPINCFKLSSFCCYSQSFPSVLDLILSLSLSLFLSLPLSLCPSLPLSPSLYISVSLPLSPFLSLSLSLSLSFSSISLPLSLYPYLSPSLSISLPPSLSPSLS